MSSLQTDPQRASARRFIVIGCTGSGKTTMAQAISKRLSIPHVEMDSLFWKPGWGETPDDELFSKVDGATRGDAWVLDGNYSRTRPITWPRAQTIVWLDYRFPRIFWQLLRRTIKRCISREPMWGGCIERFWPQIISSDSILWWAIKTYRPRRRNYPRILGAPEHRHLVVHRFRTPRQAAVWLRGVE